MDRGISFILSFAIFGLAWLLRRGSGTWGTPAGLFCLFWFLFSFVPLLAVPSAPINPLSLGYLLLACLAFSAPAFAVNWADCMRINAKLAGTRAGYLDSRFMWSLLVFSSTASIVFVMIDFVVQGLGLRDLIFNFFDTASQYLELRYEGVGRRNFFGQWGLVLAYLASTAGGLLYASHRVQRRGLVLLAAMLPSVAILLIQAAKGMFFVSIALILGGGWLYRTMMDIRPHVSFRGVLSYSKYAPVVVPLIVVSFLTRGLYEMRDVSEIADALLSYLRAYAFMHVYAFSDWFSFYLGQPAELVYAAEPPASGFFSLIALFHLLGSSKGVPPGTYGEYFFIEGANPGNLFTMFRGLISDFGIGGSLICMLSCGYVVNAFYRRMLTSHRPAISIGVMFIFVHALYTSYMISAFIWMTTMVVSVLTIAIFVLNRWSRE